METEAAQVSQATPAQVMLEVLADFDEKRVKILKTSEDLIATTNDTPANDIALKRHKELADGMAVWRDRLIERTYEQLMSELEITATDLDPDPAPEGRESPVALRTR